ncbi:MAG: dTDP-4-dehydrorhamnose reductase [Rhizobiaceae bacterium]
MRIAVTGRNGQVVSALREVARADGVDIITLARPDMDLADPASVRSAVLAARPDLVINAAAYTAVDAAEDDEATAFAINAGGVQAMAEASAALGVPLFQISTDYVFDGSANRPYVEADIPAPLNVYGRSKLAGEVTAAANPRHAIFRTSWVHSAFGPNFIATMLRLARTRTELTVVADQIGSPTAALDIAQALLAMAGKAIAAPDDPKLSGVFHLTATGATSWAGLAEFVFAESARLGGPGAKVVPTTTAAYGARAPRPLNSRLGGTRLYDSTGIAMRDWREGAAATVARLLAEDRLIG